MNKRTVFKKKKKESKQRGNKGDKKMNNKFKKSKVVKVDKKIKKKQEINSKDKENRLTNIENLFSQLKLSDKNNDFKLISANHKQQSKKVTITKQIKKFLHETIQFMDHILTKS